MLDFFQMIHHFLIALLNSCLRHFYHSLCKSQFIPAKAELQQVGIFFALNFLPWVVLLIKKLEIEKTETT